MASVFAGIGEDTSQTKKALDFSFFDTLAPRSELDSAVAPAIAAVMSTVLVDSAIVQNLVDVLVRVRQERAVSPYCSCCEINAVMYNKLVPRLVELREYAAASKVLDMMVEDGFTFTTVDDDWVRAGNLHSAVEALRALMRQRHPPSGDTLSSLFMNWLEMGPGGLRAAVAANTLLCDFGGSFDGPKAQRMVRALLGAPNPASEMQPETPETHGRARALRQMLVDLFHSKAVDFVPGTVAQLLLELEEGCYAAQHQARMRRELVIVIAKVCQARWIPEGHRACIRSEGVFFRVALRHGDLTNAFGVLQRLAATNAKAAGERAPSETLVDISFLSSAVHTVGAAAAATAADATLGLLAQDLVELTHQVCALVASCPHIQLKHSVLNQALTTLRGAPRPSTCESGEDHTAAVTGVAAALFDGLHSLHAKSVNNRTFDRLLELLLRHGCSSSSSADFDPALVPERVRSALKRIVKASADVGYVASWLVAGHLEDLGLKIKAAPRRCSVGEAPDPQPRRISFSV